MMKSFLTTQLNYHYWAHARVWGCIETLTDNDFRRQDANGSVYEQLVRMMAAENLWINFLWHGEVEFLTAEQFPTLAAIREEWSALEEETRDYVDMLREDELQQEVTPPFWEKRVRLTVGEALLHLFNSATDNRARLLTCLSIAGAQTTTQDFYEHVAAKHFIHPLAAAFESGVRCAEIQATV